MGGYNDGIMTMVPNLQSKMRWDIVLPRVAGRHIGVGTDLQRKLQIGSRPDRRCEPAPGKIDYSSAGGSPMAMAMLLRRRHFADACAPTRRDAGREASPPDRSRWLSGPRHSCGAGARRSAEVDRGDHRKRLVHPDVPTVSESGLPGFFFIHGLRCWRPSARQRRSSRV